MRTKLFAGVAFAALMIPASAFAQSTGTIDAEASEEIVVTGTRLSDGVNGIVVPDTSKARGVLTAEFIQRQAPGQTVNELINQLPGVSFQNSDPYGSSGGTMSIRGFDSTRISQTFDGVPLNDSGNYAIYSNQQIDPELIQQVNVNLGSTDIDSPTAGATGSTVNYRTRQPLQDFGVKLVGSVGDFGFFRVFGVVDTGEFTSFGTRAYISGSTARNDSPFNNYGLIEKQQYNGKIYQPIGSNGDFISVSGHYNENRNNFQASVPLRIDTAGGRAVGPNSTDRFPGLDGDVRRYNIAPCTVNTVARPGVADLANSCGSIFDQRMNPSNTGNVRLASRLTLADGLVLAVDPSYQYVKANGGGTAVAQEAQRDINPATAGGGVPNNANCNTTANSATVNCLPGYWGGTPYFGRDLNGDGDTLDTVRVLAPSQTQTHRIGLISSLRYDLNESSSIRVAYTYDRARHRQTGETNMLTLDGKPTDPFAVNNGLADRNGDILQKRNRLSFAILHKFAVEYNGAFFEDTLRVNAGLALPFMRRNLTNYCATSSVTGFVECGTPAQVAAYIAANPTQAATGTIAAFPTQGAQKRVLNYKKLLPSFGYVADLSPTISMFGSFSMGLQVPGTDNLYNSFYYPFSVEQAKPKPEKTDNFDTGLRYRSSKVQAQATVWYTNYTDRLSSGFDPETERSLYRNLGKVKRYGFDGSIAFQPVRMLSLYAFGSYLKSEIVNNVQIGRTTAAGLLGPVGTPIYAPTAGKRESNVPVYTFGGGATLDLGEVSFGIDAKRTGPRYIYDTNEPIRNGLTTIIYPNKAPAYTLVNANVRLGMEWAGLNKNTYIQMNVLNLFDEYWVGGINSGNPAFNQGPTYSTAGVLTGYSGSAPFTQIGYPRTVMGSLVVGF
ncbi:MAG: TonB-dependent receptor [Sphingomonadales bacterium]|nr:MAG: TonB-dependent receptor [Sphingomonadales bacterium]